MADYQAQDVLTEPVAGHVLTLPIQLVITEQHQRSAHVASAVEPISDWAAQSIDDVDGRPDATALSAQRRSEARHQERRSEQASNNLKMLNRRRSKNSGALNLVL
jgi:hypothetical protein